MNKVIPFNKPVLIGPELDYIKQAVQNEKLSGNGEFTHRCQTFFEKKYGFKKCLMTTSCTDALEMCAILLNIQEGDEIIMPSFTFVSTANAFVLRGAKIVFCDSRGDHPGMDESQIEELITPKTKAIVVVHYAGVASGMGVIMDIAGRHNLFVVEDAAQAIDNYYIDNVTGEKRALGGIGHLGAFSFHETKNISSGEGGMLVINDDRFVERAEIIWEKGTNRSAFFRGQIDKYGWVDIGSSFLPSELTAAYLWGQLEHIEEIQKKRIAIWNAYNENLKDLNVGIVTLPSIPDYSTNNGHLFYIVCNSLEERTALISFLRHFNIDAVFHYQSLHKSTFIQSALNPDIKLPNCERYSDCLLRLPFYFELQFEEIELVTEKIKSFYGLTS